ncbi:MAG: phosphotransferase, partial [Planctomycetes bacterium]|nr:phosphotransferase [Planctomycetota bacterium]
MLEDRARQKFGTEELAVVLSHYDLGVVESITPFKRGSRQSPKVGVVCQRGKFLLKKRAHGRKSERKVDFAHGIQQHLAAAGFPLAKIVSPRTGQTTYTQLGSQIYELFEYASGHAYDGTISQTRDAGRTLARFHQHLSDFELPENAPTGVYHDTIGVRTALNAIPSSIDKHDSVSGKEAELLGLIQRLFEAYDEAAEQANA